MNQLTYSVVEVFISLVVESTILAGIFSYLANRANEKQEMKLQSEMMKIEQQNKMIFENLSQLAVEQKKEIISQIKESANRSNATDN
jgi:cell division protein FtsB